MDDRSMHGTYHERQEQRNSYNKLQTTCWPSTDVETVDKYILRSNGWRFELSGSIDK